MSPTANTNARIIEVGILGVFITNVGVVWLAVGWYLPHLQHVYFWRWAVCRCPYLYHLPFTRWYMHYLPWTAGLSLCGTGLLLWLSKSKTNDRHLRGVQLLKPAELNQQFISNRLWRRRHGLEQRIHIGKVILPTKLDSEHFLITGSPGAGKSTLIRHMLYQIRGKAHAAIIHDPDGEFVQEFYVPEAGDIVLNPLDARCPFWTPWSEFRYGSFAMDAEALAASLLRGSNPAYASPGDQFFLNSSRTLLEAMFQVVKTRDNADGLIDFINQPRAKLQKALAGTRAFPLVDPDAHGQSAGILGTVANAIKAFHYLPTEGPAWSAAEWARHPTGWIFLSSTEDARDAIQALQGMWLDCLVRWLMCNPINGRQVWIMADELPALGYQPQIEKLVTRGRKRNLCAVLGFQNVSQLRSIYGREGAITLTSAPTTKVILRCDEAETAKWASNMLGSHELERQQVTRQVRAYEGMSVSQHRASEQIVTAAEIQLLQPLHGYLSVAGHNRTTVCISPRYLQARKPAFAPRQPAALLPDT